MEKFENKVTTDNTKTATVDKTSQGGVWEDAVREAYEEHDKGSTLGSAIDQLLKNEQHEKSWDGQIDRLSHNSREKVELLTKTAREIAKFAALDGKLSDEEKGKIHDAFSRAYDMGCERELVKSINEQLKEAGSHHRVFLDKRQEQDTKDDGRISRLLMQDRKVLVMNTTTGEVVDSAKFRVLDKSLFDRPIKITPIDPDLINPPRRWPEPIGPIDPIGPIEPPKRWMNPMDTLNCHPSRPRDLSDLKKALQGFENKSK